LIPRSQNPFPFPGEVDNASNFCLESTRLALEPMHFITEETEEFVRVDEFIVCMRSWGDASEDLLGHEDCEEVGQRSASDGG